MLLITEQTRDSIINAVVMSPIRSDIAQEIARQLRSLDTLNDKQIDEQK